MEDKTVDFQEGFALMRAYICTGSSDWLIGKDSDGPDLKLIKWVRKQAVLIQGLSTQLSTGFEMQPSIV